MECHSYKVIYSYKVFGLIIKSELELPELIKCEGKAEIMISIGKVPEYLQKPMEKTPWYEIEHNKFLLIVNGVAKYYVENGFTIIIEPVKVASEELIRLFLLNSVLTPLLLQRGFLTLHGSAVVINGKAVAVLGNTVAGKTSIALTLYERGYQLMTDEICAINLVNEKAFIFPGIPQLNVWQDTLLTVNKNIGNYKPIRQGLEKYALCVNHCFAKDAVELAGIVLLSNHNLETIFCERIKGISKLEELTAHSNYLDTVPNKVKLFQILTEAGKVPMLKLSFNKQLNQSNELADIIEKEWK